MNRSLLYWIIGQTTNANKVTLYAGNSANVTASGKAVFIGQNAGSNSNILVMEGLITASNLYIGSINGNTGNTLQLDSTATFASTAFRLAPANFLTIQGNYTNITSLLTYLGTTPLQVWNGGAWTTVNGTNYTGLITESFATGYTTIAAIPEPSAVGLVLVAGAGWMVWKRRKAAL